MDCPSNRAQAAKIPTAHLHIEEPKTGEQMLATPDGIVFIPFLCGKIKIAGPHAAAKQTGWRIFTTGAFDVKAVALREGDDEHCYVIGKPMESGAFTVQLCAIVEEQEDEDE